jgi:hypothetical protein
MLRAGMRLQLEWILMVSTTSTSHDCALKIEEKQYNAAILYSAQTFEKLCYTETGCLTFGACTRDLQLPTLRIRGRNNYRRW